MDSGAPSAKKLKLSLEMELVLSEGLSNDEVPTAGQTGAPNSALVERILDNFDVWQCIFAFMGIRKRIQVEMVNKRLRSMMSALWTREMSFDTASVIKELIGDPEKKKRADGVLAICGRMGNGLRSLTLSDELAFDWSKDLSSISNTCPNIESIHFHVEARDLHDSSVVPSDLRFDMFINLKDLSFSSSYPDVDCEERWVRAPACVFLSIPSSIERIDRFQGMGIKEDPQFETGQQLEQFFASRPSLRMIRVSGLCRTLDGSTVDIFRVISQQCPLLKKVHLRESDGIDIRFDAIDLHGIVSLESMEEIYISSDAFLSDAEVIEICERNPLVEVLMLGGYTCENLSLSALGAVAALRNLRELFISFRFRSFMPEAQVTKYIRQLATNSGASLRRLGLGGSCRLSPAAIEVLAERCTKLRYLSFTVVAKDTTPACIRHLIDCLVADPSWSTDGYAERIRIRVDAFGDAVTFASFEALTGAAANLPAGVSLEIHCWRY